MSQQRFQPSRSWRPEVRGSALDAASLVSTVATTLAHDFLPMKEFTPLWAFVRRAAVPVFFLSRFSLLCSDFFPCFPPPCQAIFPLCSLETGGRHERFLLCAPFFVQFGIRLTFGLDPWRPPQSTTSFSCARLFFAPCSSPFGEGLEFASCRDSKEIVNSPSPCSHCGRRRSRAGFDLFPPSFGLNLGAKFFNPPAVRCDGFFRNGQAPAPFLSKAAGWPSAPSFARFQVRGLRVARTLIPPSEDLRLTLLFAPTPWALFINKTVFSSPPTTSRPCGSYLIKVVGARVSLFSLV